MMTSEDNGRCAGAWNSKDDDNDFEPTPAVEDKSDDDDDDEIGDGEPVSNEDLSERQGLVLSLTTRRFRTRVRFEPGEEVLESDGDDLEVIDGTSGGESLPLWWLLTSSGGECGVTVLDPGEWLEDFW